MEEDTVELFDYFRVVWKRKILIIVVILVCTVVGVAVAVKDSIKRQLPVTSYRASVVVSIGQKMKMTLSDAYLVPLDNPKALVQKIPIAYKEKIRKTPGYHLDIEQVGMLSMLRLNLTGPDEGVERALKEMVGMLIDEHRINAESSAVAYKDFIKKLEADARMIHENIVTIEASIIKMKGKEKMFLERMDANEEETEEGQDDMGDLSVIWNMLYLKTIDKEIDLSTSRQSLRNIQWQLLVHRTTMDNLEDYNTKMIGKIIKTAIAKESNGSTTKTMSVAVVAGLIMSLFIAFLTEYVMESRSRRKGK